MSWTHLSDTTPRARKRYRCILCDGHIEHGQPHVARRGITDDGPRTFRMHILCESISKKWEWWEWEDLCDPLEFRRYEIEDKGLINFNISVDEHEPI